MSDEVDDILITNRKRNSDNNAPFDPISGLGAGGERFSIHIPDFPIQTQLIPVAMRGVPLIQKLIRLGSINALYRDSFGTDCPEHARLAIIDQFVRIRCRHDFPFWAASFVRILSKEPGQGEILFRLSRPQRKFINTLEEMRTNNKPIRIVLLKARQWGGSTASQLYMAWLQLVHKVGLNSAIISQTKKTSFAIKAMYDRTLESYPVAMLHPIGDPYDDREPKMTNVGLSGDYKKIPQRDCTITIASYEAPDALRGDAYALVHCSEVGLWSPTDKKSPDSVVRSACSGVLLRPYTMIIYESTANGTGNFFQREYDAAKSGLSQFKALFISWFDIDLYRTPFSSESEKADFARNLWLNRKNQNVSSNREEPGAYLWWLWTQGATLEAINWYIAERAGKDSHEVMAAEYPTDDVEAFVHSGARVFDKYRVEALRRTCKPPKFVGEISADAVSGPDALSNVHFSQDRVGQLNIWAMPEIDPDEKVTDRYLVVVDIGGRSIKSDWSVIAVFDRLFVAEGGKPVIVAQWYGHIDMDLLAWKAAQVALFYDNALLAIESNTLETHDKNRSVDGDQSDFILNQIKNVYDNLYERQQTDAQIAEGAPKMYGFHTNVGNKPTLISTLIMAVRDGLYIERDQRCLDEFLTYEKKPDGKYGAIPGKHDDLLMTRAIGLYISFCKMDVPRIFKVTPTLRPRQSQITEATF